MISTIFLFLLLPFLGIVSGASFYQLAFRGKIIYMFYPLILFLAASLTIQIALFDVLSILEISNVAKYSKDVFLLLGILAWIIYQRQSINKEYQIFLIDYTALAFIFLVLLFYILPIGEASLTNKTIYLKNILVVAALYFLGRNMTISKRSLLRICHLILILAVIAFPIALFEKITGIHFHKLIGYTDYIIANGQEPTGMFDLTYTFQASGGAKRFASFFASPLELATFSILSFSICVILYYTQNNFKNLYLLIGAISVLNLIFSYSRAPLAGLFIMVLYVAFLFGYWRYIVLAFAFAFVIVVLPLLFGSDDVRYLIIDTFTLADPSSVGHALDWLIGIESMINNPFGIGLATSGNAGGVEEYLQVGGENQFIIFGVQLGWIGMILYTVLVFLSISVSRKAFVQAEKSNDKIIPFIATTFKFAFLMSLLTANAEIYGLVTYISWWLVGMSVPRIKKPSLVYA